MIFLDEKRYGVTNNYFLNEHYIAYGFFGSIKSQYGLTPDDASGISYSKKEAILKCYNEFLERFKMGGKIGVEKEIPIYNNGTNSFIMERASDFSYGYNKKYGYIDTTGTAARFSHGDAMQTALNELIEKNELFLFWYKNCGCYVEKTQNINELIRIRNYASSRIEIFETEELSNMSTFIVVGMHNGRIKTSGISTNINPMEAINKALDEARLLEWINYNNVQSSLENVGEKSMAQTVNYLENKCNTLKKYKWDEFKKDKIIYQELVKNIQFAVLNNKNDFEGLVLKCISKDLFNCIPLKERILKDCNKNIMKRYGITKADVHNKPDCILL